MPNPMILPAARGRYPGGDGRRFSLSKYKDGNPLAGDEKFSNFQVGIRIGISTFREFSKRGSLALTCLPLNLERLNC